MEDITDEETYADGMCAKFEDGLLTWIDGKYIEVDDLPLSLIYELRMQPHYAAVHICESYLNDED